MNHLTKILLEDILEADNKKITAIYGGGFKPPTKGHFNVIEKAAEQNPEIDDIIIYVGGGERDGITQGESIQIWELYKKYLPIKTIVEPVKAPVGDILRYAKEHPEETVLWIIGARENNPEDFTDIASRTRTIEKYPNLQLRVIQTAGGVSGTAARKAVRDNNQEQFYHLIPDIPEKEQVWDIVSPVVTEGVFKDLKSTLKSIWSKGGKLTQDIIDGAKREGKETSKLIQLLNKMLHGDSITDDEKIFMKAQGKDLLKVLPLVAIQGIPLPIPITPLLLVLGKKFGFNILPDSHEVMPLSSLAEVNNSYQKALSKTEEEALELTYKNWDTFGGKECNNGFCDIFAKNLSKYLPGSKIMSTEDPRNNTLGHVWVEYEGKYFDAETPNGVNSWKQLPWMIEFYSKNKSHPTDIETLNEVGEANLKPYKWKEVDRESYFVYTRFETESETQYDVDLKSTNYVDDDLNNLRALGIEFSAKLKGDEGSSAKIVVNKGEMYRVMSTIADIIKTYIKKSKSQAILYSPSKKSDEEDFGTQRDNLYRAFISKAFPGVKFKQDGEIVAAILPGNGIINEVGEANLKPYKWKEVDREGWFVYTRFITDNETQYDVNLETTYIKDPSDFLNDESNPIKTLEISFGAKPKGAEGSSDKIVVNKGEMYKVMSTITDIVKHYIKKFKSQAVTYSPAKKGNEDFGTQRDSLYKAFISKALPGVKFEKYENSIIATLPETMINEGRYDSITNQLSKLAFKAFKDIHDKGDKKGKFSFTVGPDDEDIQSDEFEFDYTGVVEITDDKYTVDGGSNEGFDDKGNEITPLIVLKFRIPQNPDWQKVSFDIKDVVRHELEHLTQDGLNLKGTVTIDDPRAQNDPKLTRPGKYMQNDQFIRNMIDADSLPKANYFRLEKEVDAMLQGMYFKAIKSRTPFKDVINDYFEKVGLEGEDKQNILDLWTKRLKALNLPAIQETDIFGLNELAKTFVKETFEKTWNLQEGMLSLSKYMIDNGMNIMPLPKIKVIKDDEQNASDLLGKTAYYNPVEKSITLYTMDRHPKDILRSFAHEIVHHEQNLEGRLNNINTTNTNEDGILPEIEKEAYEKGNMMLRNWEDSIKNV